MRKDWVRCAWDALQQAYKFCVMDTEHIGRVTRHARIGDRVAIILGCSMPVVLRPTQREATYQVIGESIFHRLMDGEGLGLPQSKISPCSKVMAVNAECLTNCTSYEVCRKEG